MKIFLWCFGLVLAFATIASCSDMRNCEAATDTVQYYEDCIRIANCRLTPPQVQNYRAQQQTMVKYCKEQK